MFRVKILQRVLYWFNVDDKGKLLVEKVHGGFVPQNFTFNFDGQLLMANSFAKEILGSKSSSGHHSC
uniref:Uncharacterized protein n=1 Tax=Salix viminalis TaxID=40686 RepID=A0A6N2LID8_SALVM